MFQKLLTLSLFITRYVINGEQCGQAVCSNGGVCINGMCVCTTGFHPPICQECSSIDNCEATNCTNAYDHVCLKCEGNYGADGAAFLPSPDGKTCIEQCSWRDSRACFPGTCNNGLESCQCHEGFTDTTCLVSSLRPEVYDYIGTLSDGERNISTSNHNLRIRTYTNDFADRFTISWRSEAERPIVDLPPYVSRWSFGIASVEAQITIYEDGSSVNPIAFPTCTSSVSRDYPARVHNCEETIHLSLDNHNIKTGDSIRGLIRIITGGNRVITNLDVAGDVTRETYRTDYFRPSAGSSVVEYVEFTFDIDKPYHCTTFNCQRTMLDVGKDVTTMKTVSAQWSNWIDDFAGIEEYTLTVYRLELQQNTALLKETQREYEIKLLYYDSTEVGLQLPSPGLYSIILEVQDKAMNVRLARRFILFDDTNPPEVKPETSIRFVSENGEVLEWLRSVGDVSVDLDWSGHFWSRFVHENLLLNEIDEYLYVDEEYDQVNGTRGRLPIDNVNGIVEFEVSTTVIRDDIIVSSETVNSQLNTRYTFTYTNVRSGDVFHFVVTAWDVFGRTVEDSASIKTESTAPVITNLTVSQNGRTFETSSETFTEVNYDDSLSVQVSVQEDESRLDKLMRRLVTYHILSPDPIEIDKEVIRVEEYCAMMPSKCVAGETYDYKALVYELSLDFSQIQSDEDQKYTVDISVSNEAQLISTAKVKFLIKASAVDPVATMSSPASKTSLPVKIVTGKSQESTNAIGATSSETSLAGPIGGSIGAGLLILIIIVIWVICRRNREKRSDEEFDNIYSIPYSEAPAMNNENCTPTEKNSNVIYDNHIQRVRLNSYDNRKAVNRVNYESELNFEKGAVGGADNINYELPIEDSIEFARENLEIRDKIGEGKFSNVMKARAYNIRGQKQWSVVAVKSLKDLNKKTDFSHELHTLRKLSPHPNLVTLLGICSHEDPFYLIFEFAEHGDLRSFLQAQQSYVSDQGLSLSSGLTPHDLIHFANGIAKGMAFLSANKVIHRDLAARNVLVGEDVQGKKLCKISDFGLSRDVLKKQLHRLSHADGLPVRWMAHESLFEHVYTTMSDVWSFGIVVWEIITLGARPYAELSARQVMTALQAGKRLEKPSHCSDYLYKVMTGCWHEVPGKRPTFSELVETLNPNSNSIVLQFDIFDKRRYSGHFVLNRTDSSDAIPEIDNGHYVDMQ